MCLQNFRLNMTVVLRNEIPIIHNWNVNRPHRQGLQIWRASLLSPAPEDPSPAVPVSRVCWRGEDRAKHHSTGGCLSVLDGEDSTGAPIPQYSATVSAKWAINIDNFRQIRCKQGSGLLSIGICTVPQSQGDSILSKKGTWYIVYVKIGHSNDWRSVTSMCFPFSASSEGRIRKLREHLPDSVLPN